MHMTNSQSQRKNRLLKVQHIQKEFLKYYEETDFTKKAVWRKYFRDQYHISYRSFVLHYINCDPVKMLAELEEEIRQNPKNKGVSE